MNKIESAKIIKEKNGDCRGMRCDGCFNEKKCDEYIGKNTTELAKICLADAEAYIKRHEQKCRRKKPDPYTPDVQPDKTGSKLVKIKMNVTPSFDCPARIMPQPIKLDLPAKIYCVKRGSIEEIAIGCCQLGNDGLVLKDGYKCYRTIEDAVKVFKGREK